MLQNTRSSGIDWEAVRSLIIDAVICFSLYGTAVATITIWFWLLLWWFAAV